MSSEQIAESRPRFVPVWALRMLIRNDEALIEFFQQSVDRAAEESTCVALGRATGIKDRWQATIDRLQFRRALLAARAEKLSPVGSSFANAAPSSGAIQPDTLATS